MFFNADEHQELSFDPLADGFYVGVVTAASKQSSRAGSEYLKVQFQVDNNGDKRTVFNNYNLWHQNPTASKMATGQFAKLCNVTGRKQLQSENDLVGGRCGLKIGHKEYRGEVYNFIKDVVSSDKVPQQQGVPAQSVPVATTPARQPFPSEPAPVQRSTMDLQKQPLQVNTPDGIPF